jgi:hypothetical protein
MPFPIRKNAMPHNDAHKVTITVPSIPGSSETVPVGKRDADYYREAAVDIRYQAAKGELAMGRTMAENVAKLCEAAADALELKPEPQHTHNGYQNQYAVYTTTPVAEPLKVDGPSLRQADMPEVPRTADGAVDVEAIQKFAEEDAWAYHDWFEADGVLRYLYSWPDDNPTFPDKEETMVYGGTPETVNFMLHVRDDVKELLSDVAASRTGRMNRGTRLDLKSILARRNAVNLTSHSLLWDPSTSVWTLFAEDGQTVVNFYDYDLEDDAKLAIVMWKAIPELVEELEDFNQNWNK